ncbi:hypothetical protein ACFWVC_14150 [Streptomyces sp. NPDC058691]|uniref:hypothetical protein n=1 Tax=Streptomyces sp. NPDC058691 TaxID=3346601 RepID=UPI003653E760
MTVGGTGSPTNPYTISAGTSCSAVRGCLSAGDGLDFNAATGEFSADLSAQAGNNLTIAGDGGLFVPTGAATVTVGCGLTGNGSAGSPVTTKTTPWPYACAAATSGSVVACDAGGTLRGEPRTQVSFTSFTETRNYADLVVPGGLDNTVDTFTTTFTNPDTCRPAMLIVEREADVDFNLPAGAAAAYGQENDEVYYVRNSGSSAILDAHSQSCKVSSGSASTPRPWTCCTRCHRTHRSGCPARGMPATSSARSSLSGEPSHRR